MPGWHVAWSGDQAMAWVWPQEELSAGAESFSVSMLEDGLESQSAAVSYVKRFIPESLLRGEPLDSGAELVICSDGFEARAWRQGALYASNWWPQAPDQAAWTTFCRGAGIPPAALPEVTHALWREKAWTVLAYGSLNAVMDRVRHQVLPAVVGLLLLALCYQLGSMAKIGFGQMTLNRQIESSTAKVSDILGARNRAEDDMASIRGLLGLRSTSPQVRLLATVARLLDEENAKVAGWSMPNPDTVEVTISMVTPDPRALVLAFQKSGAFTRVTVEPGRGSNDQLVVRAQIKPVTKMIAAGAPG